MLKEVTLNNRLKRNVFNLVRILTFLLILCICFFTISNIVKRKYAYDKMADFFKQEEDFNVLFFGSSHMLNAVFPMELWKDYGIISYNMANGEEKPAASYYNMLLACRETKPDVIVIDSYYLCAEGKTSYTIHNTLDIYPFSITKFLAVKDLFGGLDEAFEYLMNFSIYHARWKEITENDFKKVDKYEKGAQHEIMVAKPNEISGFKDVEMYKGEGSDNTPYLGKIIEYCNENDIKVLVTYLPYPASDENIGISKYAQKICDNYGVRYINFLDLGIVNYDIDCSDKSSHLNPSGARKVTNYIGNYLVENYNVPDQRKNKDYSFWYEDYDEYVNFKISNLKKNTEKLENYLMLLYNEDDIGYEIKVSNKMKVEEDSVLQKLLENIDNNYEIDDKSFLGKEDKNINIRTWDKRNGETLEEIWF